MLVLDSGAVTKLARRDRQTAAVITVLRRDGLWPPAVPSVVVVESVTGDPGRDANTNRLLKTCDVITEVPESTARRAARLRFLAKTGSAVDALVVATAEPGGQVLTGDSGDLRAIAAPAEQVRVVDI
ncbi:MAG: hypothetical protein H6519_06890 [Microthrixaceae bacterium]|nr:hypothetical protein [Acidimicrobiales bacterium]MCB9404148.1 hypothetical protein [Microthrixaceae bacterium]